MRYAIFLVAGLIAGLGVEPTLAQNRRLPAGAAVLGLVLDPATNRGVDRAVVTITGGTTSRRIMTDRRGRFLFAGLPAGTYAVGAARDGYLRGTYGQRRPDGEGQTITLAPGQWIAAVDVPVARPAVITGLVLDERGEPLIDVPVHGFRRDWTARGVLLVPAGESRTDDRGAYRLGSLVPGDYLVGVTTDQSATTDAAVVPEYFPGVSSVSAASIVTAESGREITGINFHISARALVTVAGHIDVTTVPDGAMDQVRLHLVRPADIFGGESIFHRIVGATSPAEDGTFVFEGVPPGDYDLEAGVTTEASELFWARRRVTVDDKGLRNADLSLTRALEVAGRVRVLTGSSQRVVLPETVQVVFEPAVEAPAPIPTQAVVEPEGPFRTPAVLRADRYRLRVSGVPDGLRVESILADGRDVTDEGLDLSAGVPLEVVITLTGRRTLVTGMVRGTGALGDPTAAVLVFPGDSRLTSDRYFRRARVTADGSFMIPDLPAGAYLLVAIDDAVSVGWRDPDRIRAWRAVATPVTLRTGDAALVELRRLPRR